MIKAALEKVINEDMSDIWSVLNGDERRLVVDNFTIHHFKKNHILYAPGEDAE